MGIPVQRIYSYVCNAILEPGGLTGETISVAQFLEILNDSLRDFYECSECFRKLNNLISQNGVRIYNHDYFINQVQTALSDENTIFRGSGNYWDNSDYRWQQLGPGTPQEWRDDQLPEDQIEVRPSPAWDGYQVNVPGGFYGTFSQTSSPITFDVNLDPASTGLYGTISSCEFGAVYVEFTAPMYGIPGSIVESTLNLTEIATYTQQNEITSVNDIIPDFSLIFAPYLCFFVLSRVHAMDGELKNTTLSKYYASRCQEIIRLLRSISSEVLLEIPK